MSENLKDLRKEIDAVDAQLVASLQERLNITARIGKYKAETGAELFCPEREEEKLEVLKKILGDYPYSEYVVALFRDIMDYAKLQQSNNIYGLKDIYLIGMPGCGKSVIGEKLARKMYREFIDLDLLFEKTYGISPAEMIEKNGEPAFRDKESELLRNIAVKREHLIPIKLENEKGRIISCGGGIVVRDENREFLKTDSTVIYIKRDIDKLTSNGRPLSAKVGVEKLYEERALKYEGWSDMIIENSGEIDTCVAEILKFFNRYNNTK